MGSLASAGQGTNLAFLQFNSVLTIGADSGGKHIGRHTATAASNGKRPQHNGGGVGADY